MDEYSYQKQIEELMSNPNYQNIFLEIVQESSDYFSKCIEKRDISNIKSKLENSLKEIPELNGINIDEFAIELVNYLYEHRKR